MRLYTCMANAMAIYKKYIIYFYSFKIVNGA